MWTVWVLDLQSKRLGFNSFPSQHTHAHIHAHSHAHAHLTALFLGLPKWAGTKKVKTNLDFTEARDSEWQWHQLDHMQVCTSLRTDNHASTPHSFLQTGCPSCCPINSTKALTANSQHKQPTDAGSATIVPVLSEMKKSTTYREQQTYVDHSPDNVDVVATTDVEWRVRPFT